MSKARTLAGVVSNGAVLADGTIDAAEIGNLTLPTGGDIVGTTATQTLTGKTIDIASNTLTGVQAELVSGVNIKTINGGSLLGAGDVAVSSSPGNSAIIVNTSNGFGSTATKIRRFTTTLTSVGSDITYADSATDGASFTINSGGFYAVTYQDGGEAASSLIGISINSNQLTTNIGSINAANRLANVYTYLGGGWGVVTIVTRCVTGDVIRPHTTGTNANTGVNDNVFIIRKVGVI
jgi:hypothetical protein